MLTLRPQFKEHGLAITQSWFGYKIHKIGSDIQVPPFIDIFPCNMRDAESTQFANAGARMTWPPSRESFTMDEYDVSISFDFRADVIADGGNHFLQVELGDGDFVNGQYLNIAPNLKTDTGTSAFFTVRTVVNGDKTTKWDANTPFSVFGHGHGHDCGHRFG